MSLKDKIEALERSVRRFEAGVFPPNVLVVNAPETDLDEFRLPPRVLELGTIEIGRPDPSGEVESNRGWLARLSRRA